MTIPTNAKIYAVEVGTGKILFWDGERVDSRGMHLFIRDEDGSIDDCGNANETFDDLFFGRAQQWGIPGQWIVTDTYRAVEAEMHEDGGEVSPAPIATPDSSERGWPRMALETMLRNAQQNVHLIQTMIE